MSKRLEYNFIRLEGRQRKEYSQVIQQEAAKGWRLVQILAPGAGGLWASADFFEVIFEREAETGQG